MEEVKYGGGSESPTYGNRNMETASPGNSYMARLAGPQNEFCRNWVELRLMGQ